MNVGDVDSQEQRLWLRLHKKGGKCHDMPAHYKLEADLDTYMKAGGLAASVNCYSFRVTGIIANRGQPETVRAMAGACLDQGHPAL